jgi:hypothetical protein
MDAPEIVGLARERARRGDVKTAPLTLEKDPPPVETGAERA